MKPDWDAWTRLARESGRTLAELGVRAEDARWIRKHSESIASLAGRTGVPTRTGYAASKHAMTGFFDSLRIELAESGVTVTMIYPGFVATGIRENAAGPDGKPIRVSPVKESRVMSVEDCARRIVTAIERREREVVMTARGRIGLWLKLIAPSLVDRIARRAIETGR